jgi:hypothetical protein
MVIQLFSTHSSNVVCFAVDEAGEIVHVKLDPLCPVCNLRNEPGCNFCGNCGRRLLLASKTTTQPLPQVAFSSSAPDTLSTIDLHQPASPDVSAYEDLSEPNEYNQQKQMSLCGEALREIIRRMNLLQHWYNHAPAEKRAGMHESRFQALSETKDLVLQLDGFITTLIAEEFKSKR